MDAIDVTKTINRPVQNQRPRNQLLVWIGRTLLGLLIALAVPFHGAFNTFNPVFLGK